MAVDMMAAPEPRSRTRAVRRAAGRAPSAPRESAEHVERRAAAGGKPRPRRPGPAPTLQGPVFASKATPVIDRAPVHRRDRSLSPHRPRPGMPSPHQAPPRNTGPAPAPGGSERP